MSSKKYWHKGLFAGVAPIWVSDPYGECYVHPRGILGHILLPVAEVMAQTAIFILSHLDDDYVPNFPISFDDSKDWKGPNL